MSAGRSASLCWTLLSVCLLASSSSAGQTTIRAEPGKTVSLTCKALNNAPVIVVDWSRIDPKPEEDVLLYRNDQLEYQNPSLKNRMDLQERQMKDGDVSLILNNVMIEDSGTYNCRVLTKANRRKRAAPVERISTIRLEVVQAGHTAESSREHPGLIAGVGVAVAVVLVVVVSLITVRHMKKKSSPPSSSSSSPPLQSSDEPLV